MPDDDAICDMADYHLKMRLAEALEIVRAVAYSDPFNGWYPAVDAPPGVVCRWCKAKALLAASVHHTPDCQYGHAQRLVSALLHNAQELAEVSQPAAGVTPGEIEETRMWYVTRDGVPYGYVGSENDAQRVRDGLARMDPDSTYGYEPIGTEQPAAGVTPGEGQGE